MSAATQVRLAPAKPDRDAVAEDIVSEVVRQAREKYRNELRAIILTGSLARGEASLLMEDSLCRILGDAEFLLVFRRNSERPARAALDLLETTISQSLFDNGFLCPVHLAGVSPSYLRRLPAHIFSCELRREGKVVLGKARVKDAIPAWDARQIHCEDAWHLLSNRMIEWLETLAAAEPDPEEPGLAIFYSTVKLWLDLTTSLLVFLCEYESSYQARACRLARLAQSPLPASLPFSVKELSLSVDAATAWKLDPGRAAIRRLGWSFCDDARRIAGLLWCWEAARLTGLEEASAPLQFLRSSRRPPGSWRGWLRAARECGREHRQRPWRHWHRLSRWGSPRRCIYAVGAECLLRTNDFSLQANDDLPAELRAARLRQFLPVPDAERETGASDGWRRLVGEMAWNYHQFVERTRA